MTFAREQCRMQVDISANLDCSMDEANTHAVTTRLLNFVAYPLIQFIPLELHIWPQTWAEGTYWVGVRTSGFLPFGNQAIVISYPDSAAGFLLRDKANAPWSRSGTTPSRSPWPVGAPAIETQSPSMQACSSYRFGCSPRFSTATAAATANAGGACLPGAAFGSEPPEGDLMPAQA